MVVIVRPKRPPGILTQFFYRTLARNDRTLSDQIKRTLLLESVERAAASRLESSRHRLGNTRNAEESRSGAPTFSTYRRYALFNRPRRFLPICQRSFSYSLLEGTLQRWTRRAPVPNFSTKKYVLTYLPSCIPSGFYTPCLGFKVYLFAAPVGTQWEHEYEYETNSVQ